MFFEKGEYMGNINNEYQVPRIKPYNLAHNQKRKIQAFKHCIKILEELQHQYSPIFHMDPQVQHYLAMLQEDVKALENN